MHSSQVHSCNVPAFEGACKTAPMDESQEAARRFVNEILRATGWSAYKLAKEATVVSTTITRFLNGEVTHTLSGRTLDKIRRAASRRIPQDQIDHLWLISQRKPPPAPASRRRPLRR
jgi:transcriptional regulator with XRE-family HTH domain